MQVPKGHKAFPSLLPCPNSVFISQGWGGTFLQTNACRCSFLLYLTLCESALLSLPSILKSIGEIISHGTAGNTGQTGGVSVLHSLPCHPKGGFSCQNVHSVPRFLSTNTQALTLLAPFQSQHLILAHLLALPHNTFKGTRSHKHNFDCDDEKYHHNFARSHN